MKEGVKWASMAEAVIMQDLMNAEHNDWIRKNGHCGGDPNCLICNSFMKPTSVKLSPLDSSIKKEYYYKWKGDKYTEQEFKSLIKGE